MKNLKKVLALVLVVATLFGFAAVAGATDFTDAASVKNTEAVEVMNALGVINGYTDGSFKPNGNVTRAEMAKMVTAILNGGEDVGALYSAGNVFTDCGYHWARGYIAYASNVKLVAGVGNGKFNPDGNVTGVEAAKMLLCALGYDADNEQLVGTTWASKTLALADEAGLLDGFGRSFDYSRPLSRDNAALMMLNALKADMVKYDTKGTTMTINGAVVSTGGSTASVVTTKDPWGKCITNDKDSDNYYTVQLGEKCFGDTAATKGLWYTSNDDGKDAFKRPAHIWTYDNEEIGTYRDTADVTYTEEVKWDTIRKDTGKIKETNLNSITVYVDGAETGSYTYGGHYNTTNTFDQSGTGVLTEVYLQDTADGKTDLLVVVVNTYAGEITKYTAEKTNKSGDVTTEESITVGGMVFETHDFTKDNENDWVLYTKSLKTLPSTYEVQEVIVPESVEGTMSRYSSANAEITVGGTKYALAEKHSGNVESINGGTDFDGTYEFYLDSYGNVIAAKLVEASGSTNYIYVTKIQAKDEAGDLYDDESKSVKAEVIHTDGKKETVNVRTFKRSSTTYYNKPTKSGTVTETALAPLSGSAGDVGYWFNYTTNSDGEYTFKQLDSKYAHVVVATASALLEDGKAPIIGSSYYVNSRTVVTNVDDDNKVTTFTGLPTDDVTFDTGSKILVTHANDSRVATAIYAVDQSSGLSTDDVTYAWALRYEASSDGNMWTFAVDGEEVEYLDEDGLIATADGANKIYTLSLSGDKLASGTALVTTGLHKDEYGVSDDGSVTVVKATKTEGAAETAYSQTDDYAVYDVSDDGVTTGAIAEDDQITYVLDSGKIAIVFITEKA